MLIFLVGLVLDDGSDDGDSNDAAHVDVEPVREGTCITSLKLLNQGEFVGEASSIETNSSDEHVGAAE